MAINTNQDPTKFDDKKNTDIKQGSRDQDQEKKAPGVKSDTFSADTKKPDMNAPDRKSTSAGYSGKPQQD